MEDLNNSGAALTAVGYLQYTDMSASAREELRSGLLRYCELDTLEMMMIWLLKILIYSLGGILTCSTKKYVGGHSGD